MNDSAIRDLTLGTWAAGVWEKELRGVALVFQEASLAYCMRQHTEWRDYWNRLGSVGSEDAKVVNILVHIYNDAAAKLQIDRNDPPEIRALYQLLRGRGITDMDALHAIAFVLQEQTWHAKNTGEPFDLKKYVDRAKSSVQGILENPKLIRSSKIRPV
jgi:Domain of unknown function (DUF1841)